MFVSLDKIRECVVIVNIDGFMPRAFYKIDTDKNLKTMIFLIDKIKKKKFIAGVYSLT